MIQRAVHGDVAAAVGRQHGTGRACHGVATAVFVARHLQIGARDVQRLRRVLGGPDAVGEGQRVGVRVARFVLGFGRAARRHGALAQPPRAVLGARHRRRAALRAQRRRLHHGLVGARPAAALGAFQRILVAGRGHDGPSRHGHAVSVLEAAVLLSVEGQRAAQLAQRRRHLLRHVYRHGRAVRPQRHAVGVAALGGVTCLGGDGRAVGQRVGAVLLARDDHRFAGGAQRHGHLDRVVSRRPLPVLAHAEGVAAAVGAGRHGLAGNDRRVTQRVAAGFGGHQGHRLAAGAERDLHGFRLELLPSRGSGSKGLPVIAVRGRTECQQAAQCQEKCPPQTVLESIRNHRCTFINPVSAFTRNCSGGGVKTRRFP